MNPPLMFRYCCYGRSNRKRDTTVQNRRQIRTSVLPLIQPCTHSKLNGFLSTFVSHSIRHQSTGAYRLRQSNKCFCYSFYSSIHSDVFVTTDVVAVRLLMWEQLWFYCMPKCLLFFLLLSYWLIYSLRGNSLCFRVCSVFFAVDSAIFGRLPLVGDCTGTG